LKLAQNFEELIVWQKAIELSLCVYNITHQFPKSEIYGLTSQMRRASVSVASNIAEGRGRLNSGEFRQFLGFAQGSVFELKTQLIVAGRLELAPLESFREAERPSNEVSKMLRIFIEKLSGDSSRHKQPRFARV
jgi:four helix bundle protein